MPHIPSIAAVVAIGLALAGCSGGGGESIGSSLIAGTVLGKSDSLDPSAFEQQPVCPLVEIAHGAETMLIFEGNKREDPNALRYQASVQRAARDCSIMNGMLSVRVGVAGRVAAGPKGGAGEVKVPVRVQAMKGEETVYTQLQVVSVGIQAPDFSSLFTVVDDRVQIPVAISRDVTILVGFDENMKKAPEKGKPRKKV